MFDQIAIHQISNGQDEALFSGLFGATTNKYLLTATLNIASNADAQSIANAVNNVLLANGWNTSTVSGLPSGGGVLFVCNILTDWIDTDAIKQSFIDTVNNNFVANGDEAVFNLDVTKIGGTITTTKVAPKSTAIPDNETSLFIYQGKQNGFDLYKLPSTGEFFIWTGSEYELTNSTIDSGTQASNNSGGNIPKDFLSQVGGYLGFGDSNSTLGKLGIGAVAGGALALLVGLVLVSRKD